MKTLKILVIIILFSFIDIHYSNCQMVIEIENPSGKIIKQERQFQDFDGVDLQNMGDLYITQGDSDKVVIETDDNLINSVITFINGTTLYINNNTDIFPTKLNIYVTMKTFKSIISEGYGSIYAKTPLNADAIFIDMGGAGKIILDSLVTKSIKTIVNGSGDLIIKGKGDHCGSTLNGSGSLYLSDFPTKVIAVMIEGTGNAFVNASDELKVKINGYGNVYYVGKPAKISKEINGTGKLLELKK